MAKYFFRFFILVLAQVLIVQHINLTTYVVLFPYVLVIILLPFETPKLVLLLVAFLLGCIIDFFYDSSGLHASSCTLMAFARYYILKYISPREGYDAVLKPTVNDMGLQWFLSFAGALVLIHHFFFFYLEVFRFTEFFRTLLRIILSSVGTFILIYLTQFLFFTKRK